MTSWKKWDEKRKDNKRGARTRKEKKKTRGDQTRRCKTRRDQKKVMDFLKFLEILTVVSFDLPSFLFPKKVSRSSFWQFCSSSLFCFHPFFIHILHILSLYHWKLFFLQISFLLLASSPWFFRHLPVFSLLFFSTPFFLFLICLYLFCLQYLLVVLFHFSPISFLSFFDSITFLFLYLLFSWSLLPSPSIFPSLVVSTSLFLHLFSPSVSSIFSFFIPL